MTQFKAIATLSWKFNSDLPAEKSIQYARKKLEEILDIHPVGDEFDGFTVQVDLAQMKERKRTVHLGEFSPEDVFPFITTEDVKREYRVGNDVYQVRMNSDRYFVFKANSCCVACGIQGTKMILDLNPGDQSPHFNFYAVEDGRLILMTKDHILAKSKGGQDALENYATMCSACNNLKGNADITFEQLRRLRTLFNNENKLPRKELRTLINKTRQEMEASNSKEA